MCEFTHQVPGIFAGWAMVNTSIGDVQIEHCGDDVEQHDDGNGGLCGRIYSGFDVRQVDGEQAGGYGITDQRAAQQGAEDDGAYGQAFDPAIGDHQFLMGQVFGQDAVFGR